jgi:hypothetical protein
MIAVGFSGRSDGMNPLQKEKIRQELKHCWERGARHAHHGDCIGGDAEFHELATDIGYQMHVHPPDNAVKRAFCNGDVMYPPKPYRRRNQDIVDNSEVLLAAPEGEEERYPRSGTWMTVRMGLRARSCYVIVYGPEGEIL